LDEIDFSGSGFSKIPIDISETPEISIQNLTEIPESITAVPQWDEETTFMVFHFGPEIIFTAFAVILFVSVVCGVFSKLKTSIFKTKI